MKIVTRAALVSSTIIGLSAGHSAYAQNSPSSSIDKMDEIVVTAQRREQKVQDVPISLTALSGNQLANYGITSSEQLDKIAAGVVISQYGASSTITLINIRGVAQLDYADHQESPNAVYLDGAYVSFQGAAGMAMFDVDRVEILRGPQGTLFGRNATGGLVQIISRKPTDEFSGSVQALYGSFNRVRLEGAVGGGLTEELSARAAFSFNRHDGYMRNSLGPDSGADETYNGRLQLLWKPSADIENLLTFFGSKTSSIPGGVYDTIPAGPNPGNHLLTEAGKGPLFIANCQALGYGTPAAGADDCLGNIKPDDGPYRVDAAQAGTFDREIWSISNTLTWDMDDTTLTSISNYSHIDKLYQEDNDSTPQNIITYNSNQDAYQISQELRLNGEVQNFRWTAGGYFLKISGDYDVNIDLTDSFGISALGNAYSQRVETYSAFGQMEYDLSEAVTLIAGTRWTRDKKSLNLTSVCGLSDGDCTAFGFAPTGYQIMGSYTTEDWSGKLQLTWKPADDVLLYAGVNRGTKGSLLLAPAPPGPGAEFSPLAVKPEILTAYEAGIKTTVHDRLILNLNTFYYDYKDYQAYNFVNLASQIFNADARFYGAEVELSARLDDALFLNFGGAYLNTKIYDVALPDGSIADQESAQAPKFSLNASLRKEFNVRAGTVYAQASANYNSSRYFSTVNEPVLKAPGYVSGDISLGFRNTDDVWDIVLNVSNVTDKGYIVYRSNLASIAGYAVQSYAPPRQVSLQVKYNF